MRHAAARLIAEVRRGDIAARTEPHGKAGSRVSGVDKFLRLQDRSGGYALVRRGKSEEIGWMDLVELDEKERRAVVVCVTPYPKEFERGIPYDGTLHSGDVQFVHVESEEEPYNDTLTRKTLTIRFCRRPDMEVCRQVDTLLAEMPPDGPISFSPPLFEALAWRLKRASKRTTSWSEASIGKAVCCCRKPSAKFTTCPASSTTWRIEHSKALQRQVFHIVGPGTLVLLYIVRGSRTTMISPVHR